MCVDSPSPEVLVISHSHSMYVYTYIYSYMQIDHAILFGIIFSFWLVCFYSYFILPEELSVEEEAERKVGWLLKLIFLGTVSFAGYHFIPYMGMKLDLNDCFFILSQEPCLFIANRSKRKSLIMLRIFLLCLEISGDNLMQHSIKLLQVKDPLFKRMGASRLSRFAIDGMFTCCFWLTGSISSSLFFTTNAVSQLIYLYRRFKSSLENRFAILDFPSDPLL